MVCTEGWKIKKQAPQPGLLAQQGGNGIVHPAPEIPKFVPFKILDQEEPAPSTMTPTAHKEPPKPKGFNPLWFSFIEGVSNQ